MDENLLTLLEELSLRASYSEDETKDGNSDIAKTGTSYHHQRCLNSTCTSSSCVSSPTYEIFDDNSAPEDVELKQAVTSLFQELSSPNPDAIQQPSPGYDKSKLLVALLGNIDLVTCAVKKINQLVSIGKRMEQIYRTYYVNPSVPLDLDEINRLITSFSDVYNSESYVREVNVSRVYQAYCKKLIDIYEIRRSRVVSGQEDATMMLH